MIRHRMARTKGCLTRDNLLPQMFKLGRCAEKICRRLRGFRQLAKVSKEFRLQMASRKPRSIHSRHNQCLRLQIGKWLKDHSEIGLFIELSPRIEITNGKSSRHELRFFTNFRRNGIFNPISPNSIKGKFQLSYFFPTGPS